MCKSKIIFTILISVLLISGCTSYKITQKEWHVQKREYLPTDSVIFPIVDFKKIKTIKIGDSLDKIKETVGFKPVKYYIHPGYALLATKINEKDYEVAFKYNKQDIVIDISFKEME